MSLVQDSINKENKQKDEFQIEDADNDESYIEEETNFNIEGSVRPTVLVKTMDEAYEMIEGRNYFIPFYALFLCIANPFTNLSLLLPYLGHIPKLKCSFDEGSTWESCSKEEVCSAESGSLTYEYDYSSIETISNWIIKFDMLCDPGYKIAMFGTLMFVGCGLSTFTFFRLGDIYGRKPIVSITNIGGIISFLCMYLVNSLEAVYVAIFIQGICSLSKGMLLYMYYSEFVPESKRLKYHSVGSTIGFSIGYFNILFFIFMSNDLNLVLIQGLISIILQVVIFRMPESPKFLLTQNRFDEVHEALDYIAKINKSDASKIKFESEVHSTQHADDPKPKAPSLLSALKDKVVARNMFAMVINWIIVGISFQILMYYVGFFPGSIYINGLIIITADLVSSAMVASYVKIFGIKHSFTSCYLITFVASILYMFMTEYKIPSYILVFTMAFFVGMLFSLNYYTTAEIFNTSIKARSFAACSFLAKLLSALSPMIVNTTENPILAVMMMVLLACLSSQLITKVQTD